MRLEIDAKSQRTIYTYDAYKRPTQTRRGTWGSITTIAITAHANVANQTEATQTVVRLNGAGSTPVGSFILDSQSSQTYTFTTSSTLNSIYLSWGLNGTSQTFSLDSITINGTNCSSICTLINSGPTALSYDTGSTGLGTGLVEDICQREDYFYDLNPFDGSFTQTPKGRLTAVQYRGGYNSSASPTCDTLFTEMTSYGAPGNVTAKRLRVKRGSMANMDLDTSNTFDNEGRVTATQYPSSWNGSAWVAGPNIGVEFNDQGQLKKLKNLTTSTDIISGATYNPMGEMLTMTGNGGAPSETRTYNSIGQMKQLQTGGVNVQYNFSSTVNNGKISSETDVVSGETVTYTYDSLNRLASATSSVNPGWGQSFGYDGFGNLTTVNVTKGSAPSLSVSYNASTNRRTTDSADANGNILTAGVTNFDVENRITAANITNGTARYSYAPGNKRIWRGTWVSGSQTVDELTFYSTGGAKICAYNLSTSSGNLVATTTGYYEYFGGKMLKNATGYVNSDRLGSIGKYYPYGQERPSATANGKEKFATYTRDAETGLDYAQNRYHSSGDGRFLTPDPYQASGGAGDPGSWNRYAYVGGDPINNNDSGGLYQSSVSNGGCDPTLAGMNAGGFDMFCTAGSGFGNIRGWDFSMGMYTPSQWLEIGGTSLPNNFFAPQTQVTGPPPTAPKQDKELLDAAIQMAIGFLNKKGCGDTIFKKGGPDPAAVLKELAYGSKYGSVKFDDLGPGVGAQEFMNPARFVPGVGKKVTITINTYNDSSNSIYWNDGNATENAITLIHELGHAFNNLFGGSSSTIERDVNLLGKLNQEAEDRNAMRTDPCRQ